MLLQFRSISNRYLGRIKTSKHRIELLQPASAHLHSAPFRVDPKPPEIELVKIYKLLVEHIFEPAQIEWTVSIVLVQNKDRALRFWVNYHKFNAVTKRDFEKHISLACNHIRERPQVNLN